MWKFIFSIVVVTLHSNNLPVQVESTYLIGGSIGVEFFFLVSGFFLANSAFRIQDYPSLENATWRFIRKKVGTFLPYMLYGYAVSIIVKTLFLRKGFFQVVNNLILSLPELFLLKSTGMGNTFFNGPTWYLSAMIFSMLIIYPLLLKYQKTFSQVVAPIVSMLVLGYLFQKFGHFRTPDAWSVYFNKGFLRGFAEILLGVFCYECSAALKQYDFRWPVKLVATILAYGSLIKIILYTNSPTWWDMDPSTVIMMSFAIIVFGCGEKLSLLAKFWNRQPLAPALGKFSLMIYLNHIYWVWIFDLLNLKMSYRKMFLLYLFGSVCSACICWVVVTGLQIYCRKHNITWKRMLLQSETRQKNLTADETKLSK